MKKIAEVMARGNEVRFSGQRWNRTTCAEKFSDYERLTADGLSQRQIANEIGVPRTSLQAWQNHRDTLDAAPELVSFFEGSTGLAFLHRLVVALHLVFVEQGASGSGLVSKFLELSGLNRFVASSRESQRKVNVQVEKAIVSHAAGERARLGEGMPKKDITVCQDETYTGGLCLVAMEPESGFIILEQTADDRTAETWEKHMGEAMKDIEKATIIQSTSDEAKGILAYVEKTLGAAHSPDLFHVQQELSRAVGPTIRARRRTAEQRLEAAKNDVAKSENEKTAYYANIDQRGRGRPKNHDTYIQQDREAVLQANQELARIEAVHEGFRGNVRGIGESYHFVDLETGNRLSPEIVAQTIQTKVDAVRRTAIEQGVGEKGLARIDKAERVLPKMREALEFVSTHVRREIDKLGLSPALSTAIHTKALPAAYLERIAGKQKLDVRTVMQTKAAELREPLYCENGLMLSVDDCTRDAVEKRVVELAQLFQRSSSCVEGRNGVLSFRHHELHNMSERKRLTLTAIHNFFIKRRDGSTAAERFFEGKPKDLFQAVLEKVSMPSRPLSPPKKKSFGFG